ncbi:MAG TPA: hypothetical protein VLH13_03815, partial [Methanomassiliicoccales archaeon]|nr:hypothetical protein [Methanomassiliicoccales archaeon]
MTTAVTSYRNNVNRLALLPFPDSVSGSLKVDRDPAVASWMLRNDIGAGAVRSASLTSLLAMLALTVPAYLLISSSRPDLTLTALFLLALPFITSYSILSEPSRQCRKEERAVLRESAMVIGN